MIREVVGVPTELVKHFSKRRADIEDRYRQLASQYRRAHGHEPPREAQLKLSQQATLETRDQKATSQSLAAKLGGWRASTGKALNARQQKPSGPHSLGRQPR